MHLEHLNIREIYAVIWVRPKCYYVTSMIALQGGYIYLGRIEFAPRYRVILSETRCNRTRTDFEFGRVAAIVSQWDSLRKDGVRFSKWWELSAPRAADPPLISDNGILILLRIDSQANNYSLLSVSIAVIRAEFRDSAWFECCQLGGANSASPTRQCQPWILFKRADKT